MRDDGDSIESESQTDETESEPEEEECERQGLHCVTPSWFICNGEFSSNTR